MRVGDTQREKILIPKELENIVSKDKIQKYCTLPELEILLIINENLYSEFRKSKQKSKVFAKQNIVYNKYRSDQSSKFFEMYYGGKRLKILIKNIIEYKRIKKHTKDQLYLADLLK